MNIRELIDELEGIAAEHGDDLETAFAYQPAWPMKENINAVVFDKSKKEVILANSYGGNEYLGDDARKELDWSN